MDDYIFTPINSTSTDAERAEFEYDLLKEINQDYTPLSLVDYFVDREGKVPISFSQVRTVEEGFEWYRRHHPELLDDLLWVMARHQFGEREGNPPRGQNEGGVGLKFTQKTIQIDF
mgnify:CR=1 FL=1